jgi:hypothetical protein
MFITYHPRLCFAGDCYSRLFLQTFIDAMFNEIQTLHTLQTSLDGDMHQYIQWILKNRPDKKLSNSKRTYKDVLQEFLEKVSHDSHQYRKVFSKFYSSRHSNHSEEAEIQHNITLARLQQRSFSLV